MIFRPGRVSERVRRQEKRFVKGHNTVEDWVRFACCCNERWALVWIADTDSQNVNTSCPRQRGLIHLDDDKLADFSQPGCRSKYSPEEDE